MTARVKAGRVAISEDVARLAKVSQSAVSRAFTPGASIAPATRARILQVATEIGYHPNLIARSLKQGGSNIVGVGIGNLDNPFVSASLDRLSLRLTHEGLRLLLFTTDATSVMQASIQEVLQHRLDAIVLLATALPPELGEQCRRAQIPVVLYNRNAPPDQQMSSVSCDNLTGARAVAAYLVAGQHRHFAYLAGIDASLASRERETAFHDYLVESGHAPPLRENGLFTYAGAAAATRRLLTRKDRPDALFCANDLMAIAAIEVARSEFGLVVGRDISIVGFNGIDIAAWPSVSLTTFATPIDDMVDATVQSVLSRRSGAAASQTIVEGSLIIRNSARRL